jgi:GNAT superfamily N-acetyltransferase
VDAHCLRQADHADVALIARLTRECWADSVAPDSSGHREDERRVLADLAQGGALILESEEQAIGSARYGRLIDQPTIWEIMRMGILPAWRGRGLGAAFLARILDLARASKVTEIRLAVRADQKALLSYYERFGFAIVADLTYSHANRQTSAPIVMRLLLS